MATAGKMEAEERDALQKRSHSMRQELKIWEKEFATANGGRKAGREDIKQNPSIGEWRGQDVSYDCANQV